MSEWADLVSLERIWSLTRAVLLAAAGFLLARLLASGAVRAFARHLDAQAAQLLRRGVYYAVLFVFLVAALNQLGFELGVILGAAGIFSVALGFASQTSASNLISGIFLLFEGTFEVGDIIRVGSTTGEVLSVDLLSVKLRTFDNLFVRIPNETLIKSEVTTLTRFPIRRMDLAIGVAYGEDLAHVRQALFEVSRRHPSCLEHPEPLLIVTGFGESSIDLQFSVWTTREGFLDVRNSLYEEVKKAFDEEGIEIPFPHLSLYAGTHTEPFVVRVVAEKREEEGRSEGGEPAGTVEGRR